jgi:hypothetical protein
VGDRCPDPASATRDDSMFAAQKRPGLGTRSRL